MEEELKVLAELINKLEEAFKVIRENIDSPLVEYDSSAYAFLMSADYTLDFALSFLHEKYATMVKTSNHRGDMS